MNRAARWGIKAVLVGLASVAQGQPTPAQPAQGQAAASAARAAKSSARTELDSIRSVSFESVVLTATRTERRLSQLPLPMVVIGGGQIRQMGSMRLGEVLAELPGVALTQNQFGQGLQLQGFDADYTLILLDGEPLVGRTAGVLQLSRLSVADVERIEVVKGPASSLYGSEAMAGVVNVITRGVTDPLRLGGRFRYGSNATSDATLDAAVRRGRVWGSLLLNRFETGGYDLDGQTPEPTLGQSDNYTFFLKLGAELSARTRLTLSTRYLSERQRTSYAYGADQAGVEGTVEDASILPTLVTNLGKHTRWRTSVYATRYRTGDEWRLRSTDAVVEQNQFEQTFVRPETQVDFGLETKYVLSVGVGGTLESVASNRYTERKDFRSLYSYAQLDASPWARVNVVAGARYDGHSQYAGRLSPKLAVRVDVGRQWQLRGSVGAGFKAPDFRQLYLNFTNGAAGYSVYGADEIGRQIDAARAQGQLAGLAVDASSFGQLRAERSLAAQLSVSWRPSARATFNLGGFRHDVSDLIETLLVGQRTNGQQIFSYTNLGRVTIQGVEVDGQWVALEGLTLSVGYQLLFAEDARVAEQVAEGNYFLTNRRMQSGDYLGLFGRSRHMGTFKAFYEHKPWGSTAALRVIARGPFGQADGNGNGIYDVEDPRVPGHVLVNLTLSQRLDAVGVKGLEVQLGLENALDFINPINLPGLPGRLWFAALNYRFTRS